MRDWVGQAGEWRREIAAAALLGLFLGFIGPFGTWYNSGLGVRIGYWVGILVIGTVIYGFGMRWAMLLGERWRQPAWFILPLAVLIISLPMALISSTIVVAIWPDVRGKLHPFDWYGQAVILGLPLSIVMVGTRRLLPANASKPARSQSLSEPNLLDRLPPRLGRTLICLQMEDHYVRVHTERGSELVLMSLKDAIAEVNGVEGMQVHRSWWVARAAVSHPLKRGREWALKLTTGIEAPVSRAYVASLRENRWLDSDFET